MTDTVLTADPTLTIDDWIVCWTPARPRLSTEQVPGAVLVARLGDDAYYSHRYAYTAGMCFPAIRKMSLEGKVMMMFIDFHTLVVRDGIDPQAAHREFLKIDEYRARISPDIAGAMEARP